jgi:hypothetical protein
MKTSTRILIEKLESITGKRVILREGTNISYQALEQFFSKGNSHYEGLEDILPENIKEWRKFTEQFTRTISYTRQFLKNKEFYDTEVNRIVNSITTNPMEKTVKELKKEIFDFIKKDVILAGDPFKHSILEFFDFYDSYEEHMATTIQTISKAGDFPLSAFLDAYNALSNIASRIANKIIDTNFQG